MHCDTSEVDYQDLFRDDGTVPLVEDDSRWPATPGGLPLTERYLQLLPGNDKSEEDQYFQVMQEWVEEGSGSLVEPERAKRGKRAYVRDESGSDVSRAATEGCVKRRRGSGWMRAVGGGVGAVGSSE